METLKTMMNKTHLVFIVLLGSIAILTATPAAAGDAEAGQKKAETCIGCHGIPNYSNMYPTYKVPKIAGQHESTIIAALKAYRNGERQHATMSPQAAAMTDQDIEDIAAYLASLKPAAE